MRATSEDEVRRFAVSYGPTLYRSAYLLVGNTPDAEDLVQATLVRLVAGWDRIRRRDAPEVFARRVMINIAASRWRRLKIFASITPRIASAASEPDTTEAFGDRDAMWAAIHSLPPRMRAIVVLRYYDDLTEGDIAAVLGCSTGSVKSQSSRALARLRVQLTEGTTKENLRL